MVVNEHELRSAVGLFKEVVDDVLHLALRAMPERHGGDADHRRRLRGPLRPLEVRASDLLMSTATAAAQAPRFGPSPYLRPTEARTPGRPRRLWCPRRSASCRRHHHGLVGGQAVVFEELALPILPVRRQLRQLRVQGGGLLLRLPRDVSAQSGVLLRTVRRARGLWSGAPGAAALGAKLAVGAPELGLEVALPSVALRGDARHVLAELGLNLGGACGEAPGVASRLPGGGEASKELLAVRPVAAARVLAELLVHSVDLVHQRRLLLEGRRRDIGMCVGARTAIGWRRRCHGGRWRRATGRRRRSTLATEGRLLLLEPLLKHLQVLAPMRQLAALQADGDPPGMAVELLGAPPRRARQRVEAPLEAPLQLRKPLGPRRHRAPRRNRRRRRRSRLRRGCRPKAQNGAQL
mmetsp:Transcript_34813/g.100273  ORF Transcript_34813/g.100273 Transcript_34813/m.100273 type:complete len:408 (+) Transcript_34813:632-1855(+)